VLLRTIVLVATWWILAAGHPSPGFGVPVVATALVASIALAAPQVPRWHVAGLLQFVLVFVSGSLRGGLVVARRAFAPRASIAPDVLVHTLRVPAGPARNLFLGTVSVMPGTICLDTVGARLAIHVLADHPSAVMRDLDRLERCIARALGVPLESAHA
jgi:multicomponent Na+:H+ antiporter subunit E